MSLTGTLWMQISTWRAPPYKRGYTLGHVQRTWQWSLQSSKPFQFWLKISDLEAMRQIYAANSCGGQVLSWFGFGKPAVCVVDANLPPMMLLDLPSPDRPESSLSALSKSYSGDLEAWSWFARC